jgi:hypothetical protein
MLRDPYGLVQPRVLYRFCCRVFGYLCPTLLARKFQVPISSADFAGFVRSHHQGSRHAH